MVYPYDIGSYPGIAKDIRKISFFPKISQGQLLLFCDKEKYPRDIVFDVADNSEM